MTLPIFETSVVASAGGSMGMAGQPHQVAAGEPSRGSATSTTNPAVPVLTFIAHDDPIGQGNIRHLGAGRPAVHQNAKTLKPWRATVRHAAITAIGDRLGFPLNIPLHVEVTFTVKKPVGAPKTRRIWPSKRPDLDHLLRAVLDAITGVAFTDDARCVEITCAKRYPLEGTDALNFPGVVVRIYVLSAFPQTDGETN